MCRMYGSLPRLPLPSLRNGRTAAVASVAVVLAPGVVSALGLTRVTLSLKAASVVAAYGRGWYLMLAHVLCSALSAAAVRPLAGWCGRR